MSYTSSTLSVCVRAGKPLVITFRNHLSGSGYQVRRPYFGLRGLSGSVRACNSRSEVLCFHWLSIRFKCMCVSSVILVFVSSFIVSVSKLVLSLDVF